MSEPVLEFKGVCFSYNSTANVHDLNVQIHKGDFTAITGSNGAGKSTFSKLCNGLLLPSEGDVFVLGENTRRKKVSELARHIGFLFQNPDRQICCNTVEEEIAFSLKNNGIASDEVKKRVQETLETFGFDAKAEPFNLSRGQRQRLCLACLIALNPEILILDEPTKGFDPMNRKLLMTIIEELHKKGSTMILITHYMEEVERLCDRILLLRDGKAKAYGTVKDVRKEFAGKTLDQIFVDIYGEKEEA